MEEIFKSVDELNARPEFFYDSERTESENDGPFLIVCDNFYSNPNEVRRLALAQEYFQYKPPIAEQVGKEIAGQYDDPRPVWLSSSLLRFLGKKVINPRSGYRYATPEIRQALSRVIGESISSNTWSETGDWWNGAFHLQYEAKGKPHRVIHHHYREGDVAPIGWSGLVYLTPGALPEFGTTIWRERKTNRCIGSKGNKYYQNHDEFDLALSIENHFNRLVLFRENVLHRAGYGFGTTPNSARLMQTFFFQVERNIL